MIHQQTPLVFAVQRREVVVLRPATPTPIRCHAGLSPVHLPEEQFDPAGEGPHPECGPSPAFNAAAIRRHRPRARRQSGWPGERRSDPTSGAGDLMLLPAGPPGPLTTNAAGDRLYRARAMAPGQCPGRDAAGRRGQGWMHGRLDDADLAGWAWRRRCPEFPYKTSTAWWHEANVRGITFHASQQDGSLNLCGTLKLVKVMLRECGFPILRTCSWADPHKPS